MKPTHPVRAGLAAFISVLCTALPLHAQDAASGNFSLPAQGMYNEVVESLEIEFNSGMSAVKLEPRRPLVP